MTVLRAVRLDEQDRLIIIDQTKLPGELVFVELRDKTGLIDAIARLKVRGAPAIGIAAAYGVFVLARSYSGLARLEFLEALRADIAQIRHVRPTAINLAWALARMEEMLRQHEHEQPRQILPWLRREAQAIFDEDAAICRAIAAHGAPLIRDGMGVLTHCNAGWLATSELGTALAPIYAAQEQGKKFRVYCDETRPLLQGARLTAYELMAAQVETILLCDNMAASLMAAAQVDIVFVGADRVAANGDVANKIGTLSLAINAAHFGIPFYVCAPSSTLDQSAPTGAQIQIEQRDALEITEMWYKERMAPAGVGVYNAAFDVTPRELITGLITEAGIKYF
ncbi:MAG: S-methyl-5-thioribose-1-phosphate isomerase [Clostridia bacterium]|nr:S-methyl-5-thioribose-1-phosphate isomerase [Clostridia bacterium]